jgi:hypothetical protein
MQTITFDLICRTKQTKEERIVVEREGGRDEKDGTECVEDRDWTQGCF